MAVVSATHADTALLHRQQLQAIYERLKQSPVPIKGGLNLDELKNRRKRSQQMAVLKDFFSHPERVDFRNAPLPTSSTQEEIDRHRAALEYRLDCLKVLVEITESEIETLSKSKPE